MRRKSDTAGALLRKLGNEVGLVAQTGLQHATAERQQQREVSRLRARETAGELTLTIQLFAGGSPAEYDSLSHGDHSNAASEALGHGPSPTWLRICEG